MHHLLLPSHKHQSQALNLRHFLALARLRLPSLLGLHRPLAQEVLRVAVLNRVGLNIEILLSTEKAVPLVCRSLGGGRLELGLTIGTFLTSIASCVER